jgi:hypothetical protein
MMEEVLVEGSVLGWNCNWLAGLRFGFGQFGPCFLELFLLALHTIDG